MDPIQEIKTRLDVADVIGEYLPLKAAGSNAWKANCPFHQERTPSFYVSRTRQSWHCFGCDTGGDIISFVEKIEGMEFREALELLAQKAGVELPKFDKEKASQKQRLVEINELAARFFRSVLSTLPQAEVARKYLEKRGVDDLTADLFKIGYAPDTWTALTDALQKRGVTAAELVAAGLSSKRERGEGVYDRFRGRLMFPIMDVHGHVVGFTGRILTDDKKEAKYVNTPETQIYKKSAVLYGLDKAKGAIRQQDLAVIVEGNMDVVSSHQFSVDHVVAASGTALTADQLGLLKRFTKNLAIAFDQDNAGNAATLRGLDLARQQDFNIKIITLPPEAGKDPDEAVRKDPALWKEAIKEAVNIMDWVYRNAFRGRKSDRPEDKKLIVRDVLNEVIRIADAIERDHWIRKLAKDIDASEIAIREVLDQVKGQAKREPREPRTTTAPATVVAEEGTEPTPSEQIADQFVAGLIYREELWRFAHETLAPKLEWFEEPRLQALYTTLVSAYPLDNRPLVANGSPSHSLRPPDGLAPDLAETLNRLAFAADRAFQDMTLDDIKRELKNGARALRDLWKARERRRLEEAMRDAERTGDQQTIAHLATAFRALTDA